MKNAKICLKDANRLLVMIGVMIMTVLLLSGCGKLQDQSPDPQLMQDAQTAQEAPQEAPAPTQEEPAEPEEDPQTPAQETEPASEEDPAQTGAGDDWKLILVNAEHPVPEDYSVTLKELRNDQWVDERIYPELQQMFDDARAEGIYPLINESYRSAERQQEILDNYIAAYEAEGLSTEEAQQRALEVVAKPGTSEHQLGLALDIIVEYEEDWFYPPLSRGQDGDHRHQLRALAFPVCGRGSGAADHGARHYAGGISGGHRRRLMPRARETAAGRSPETAVSSEREESVWLFSSLHVLFSPRHSFFRSAGSGMFPLSC